jgi:hypothetical protein
MDHSSSSGTAESPGTTIEPDSQEPASQPRTGADLWLRRSAVLLFVLLCASTGVTLVVLPWTLQWSDNYLLTRFPGLLPIVTHGFFRGVCTGLGILDLWIGFSEAIHYHEEQPAPK